MHFTFHLLGLMLPLLFGEGCVGYTVLCVLFGSLLPLPVPLSVLLFHTHHVFVLRSCPANSLKRLVDFPKETPRLLLALARTTLWCSVGVPLRLLVLWILSVSRVVKGDEAGRRVRAAVRRTGEMMMMACFRTYSTPGRRCACLCSLCGSSRVLGVLMPKESIVPLVWPLLTAVSFARILFAIDACFLSV